MARSDSDAASAGAGPAGGGEDGGSEHSGSGAGGEAAGRRASKKQSRRGSGLSNFGGMRVRPRGVSLGGSHVGGSGGSASSLQLSAPGEGGQESPGGSGAGGGVTPSPQLTPRIGEGGAEEGASMRGAENLRAEYAEAVEHISKFESKSHVERRYNVRTGVHGGDAASLGWLLSAATGLIVGIASYAIHLVTAKLTKLKFEYANEYVSPGAAGGGGHHRLLRRLLGGDDGDVGDHEEPNLALGYLVYAAALMLLTLPGVAMVLWRPQAESSGIPGVIAYVNGVRMEKHVDWQTGLATLVGVTFAVSSGLACGPEGPVIHIGACVGRAVCSFFPKLRSSGHMLRNMVALGAGAGVAAAFLAPASGVALVLEELAYVSVEELHKTFLACVVAYWTSYWLQAAQAGDTTLSVEFDVANIGEHPECFYTWWAVPIFMLLGAICGLLGALFNWGVMRINAWRMEHIKHHMHVRRTLEVLAVGLLTATIFVWAPSLFPCRERTAEVIYDKAIGESFCPNVNVENQLLERVTFPSSALFNQTIPVEEGPYVAKAGHYEYADGWRETHIESHVLSQYTCEDGEYNAMASLLFVPAPEAIKLLFSAGLTRAVPWLETLTAFVLYFLMALITVGVALPTGMVVPNIFMGACVGRLLALGCVELGFSVEPGVMAIVGSAAMMAGSGRIMLFLTILMVELTSALLLAPPIACATISAVIVGNLFNEGLYHEFIHLKRLPVVGDHPNGLQERACVNDAMSHPATCMRDTDSVQEALEAKAKTTHNGFPVVDCDGALVGVVSTSMLEHKRADPDAIVADVMDGSPVAVRPGDALGRAVRLYRRLGLRHLPVVNSKWVPIGMITRKNLMPWVVDDSDGRHFKFDGLEDGAEVAEGVLPDTSLHMSLEAVCAVPARDSPQKHAAARAAALRAAEAATERLVKFDPRNGLPPEAEAGYCLSAAMRGQAPPRLTKANLSVYRLHSAWWWRAAVVAAAVLLAALSLWEKPRPVGMLQHWSPSTDAWLFLAELGLLGVRFADALMRRRVGQGDGRWAKLELALLVYAIAEGAILLIVHAADAEHESYTLWRPGRFIRAALLATVTARSRFVTTATARVAPAVGRVLAVVFSLILLFALIGYAAFSGLRDSDGFVFGEFETFSDALESVAVASTLSNFPAVMMPSYGESWGNALFFIALLAATAFVLANFVDAAAYATLMDACQWRALEQNTIRRNVVTEIFEELSKGHSGLPLPSWRGVFANLMVAEPRLARLDAAAGSAGLGAQTPPLADVLFVAAYNGGASLPLAGSNGSVSLPVAGHRSLSADATLTLEQFCTLVDLLEHPLALEPAVGSPSRPTPQRAEQLEGLRDLVRRNVFDIIVVCFLIVQAAVMGARVTGTNRGKSLAGVNAVSFIFSCLFMLELGMRLAARTHAALRGSLWGLADAAAIVGSFIWDLALLAGAPASLNFLPLLRFVGFLRKATKIKGFRTLGRACASLGGVLGAFTLSLGGLLHLFALLGMAIFRNAIKILPEEADLVVYCDRGLPPSELPYLGRAAEREAACTHVETGEWLDTSDEVMVAELLEAAAQRPCWAHYSLGGEGAVPCEALNPALGGTAYEAGGFYRNSFVDWPSSMVTLFELLAVHNWHVLKEGIAASTSDAAQLFFFAFYAVCALLSTRVLFAFVFDAFLTEFAAVRLGTVKAAAERAEALQERLAVAQAALAEKASPGGGWRRWIVSPRPREAGEQARLQRLSLA